MTMHTGLSRPQQPSLLSRPLPCYFIRHTHIPTEGKDHPYHPWSRERRINLLSMHEHPPGRARQQEARTLLLRLREPPGCPRGHRLGHWAHGDLATKGKPDTSLGLAHCRQACGRARIPGQQGPLGLYSIRAYPRPSLPSYGLGQLCGYSEKYSARKPPSRGRRATST